MMDGRLCLLRGREDSRITTSRPSARVEICQSERVAATTRQTVGEGRKRRRRKTNEMTSVFNDSVKNEAAAIMLKTRGCRFVPRQDRLAESLSHLMSHQSVDTDRFAKLTPSGICCSAQRRLSPTLSRFVRPRERLSSEVNRGS